MIKKKVAEGLGVRSGFTAGFGHLGVAAETRQVLEAVLRLPGAETGSAQSLKHIEMSGKDKRAEISDKNPQMTAAQSSELQREQEKWPQFKFPEHYLGKQGGDNSPFPGLALLMQLQRKFGGPASGTSHQKRLGAGRRHIPWRTGGYS